MEDLLGIDAITSQHNLKGLRHLYDTIELEVRGLRSLGVPAASYGSPLSSVLMSELTQELRLIISHEVQDEEWELKRLMGIIEREIEARERASMANQVPRRFHRLLQLPSYLLARQCLSVHIVVRTIHQLPAGQFQMLQLEDRSYRKQAGALCV